MNVFLTHLVKEQTVVLFLIAPLDSEHRRKGGSKFMNELSIYLNALHHTGLYPNSSTLPNCRFPYYQIQKYYMETKREKEIFTMVTTEIK